MMMKNLIKTLGFILALAGPSVTMAATTTDHPQTTIQDNITNTACIQRAGGSDCDTVTISPYACFSIYSTGTTVTIDSDGEGKMKFTCTASDTSVGHDFLIDCGNTTQKTGHRDAGDSQSFTHTCVYKSGDFGKTFNVSCYVDDNDINYATNPACKKGINIGYGIFGECGDGVIDTNEDCDFINIPFGEKHVIGDWLNSVDPKTPSDGYDTEHGYYCYNCKLVNGSGFVYDPAECFSTDKPISVMNNELIPFWWKLNVGMTNNNITVTDDKDDCEDWSAGDGTLIYPTNCHFAIYNGTHKQGDNEIRTFILPCYNNNFSGKIYRYFGEVHDTPADGAALYTVNAYTDGNANGNNAELGEYKIVLEEVEYEVCNPENDKRTGGKRSGPVCEVNAAITRPYAMQISTFGASPISTTDGGEFLSDFMDMQGNKLISSSTDLESIINIEDTEYSNEQNVQEEVEKFRNKYEKLAVEINNTSRGQTRDIYSKLSSQGIETVKKVPNQNIYFLYGNNKITLTSGTFNGLPAYTIFVSGMDVEIEGNLLQYAMIITTENMSFKDGGSNNNYSRCASGGQVVQGLYVAGEGFKQATDEPESLKNTSADKLWCPWGGLHVKGALIGEGIENIVISKRSQLNSWFNVNSNPMRERRQKIIGGASVLIEYSPSLWKTLPPGAEVFTESLEVYRK